MWAGYGGVAPPMVLPQQLILGDYPRALHPHPALLHVPHHQPTPGVHPRNDVKCEGEESNGGSSPSIDDDAKSYTSAMTHPPALPPPPAAHIPPHFIYPPGSATIPYYCPPSTHHPPTFPLTPFTAPPHPPSSLGSTGSLVTPIVSVTSGSVLTTEVSEKSSKTDQVVCITTSPVSPIISASEAVTPSSPPTPLETSESISLDINDRQKKRTIPVVPLKIKQEIKQEVLSPVCEVPSENHENSRAVFDTNASTVVIPEVKIESASLKSNFRSPQENKENSHSEIEHDKELTLSHESSHNETGITSCCNCSQSCSCQSNPEKQQQASDIDISGLELLSQSACHANRLEPDMDRSNDGNELESQTKPRSSSRSPPESSISRETPLPTSQITHEESVSCESESTASVLPLGTMAPESPTIPPSNFSGLNLLCALAEQRIFEEQNENALSSLADVAATTPSVSTSVVDQPQESPCIFSPSPKRSSTPQESSIPGTSTGIAYSLDLSTPTKGIDINRNYKSPQSEREVKAFLATRSPKNQTEIENEFTTPPELKIDRVDPAELDRRMQFAEIQRKYKVKQKRLCKLQSKKELVSPLKRGPGRPRKKKLSDDLDPLPNDKFVNSETKAIYPSNIEKELVNDDENEEELSPPVLEPMTNLEWNCEPDTTTDDDNDEPNRKPPVLTASVPTSITQCFQSTPIPNKNLERELELTTDDEMVEDDKSWSTPITARNNLDQPSKSPIKSEESDDECIKDAFSDIMETEAKVFCAETSVESSPSDIEQPQTNLSSSKKRKPGRPKKHSPTKEDATETIVAKKPKAISFLLMNHKPKVKPKLKAELKVEYFVH